jgi:hypothetical protein
VNARHLTAFLWLRWRLRSNQLQKGGVLNAVLLAIAAAGVVVLSVVLFVGGFLIGLLAMKNVSPAVVLCVWDGVVFAFLLFWLSALMIDLQRTEALALDKFLHYPVSLAGAFLVNYLSSLFSLTLVLFLPAMAGLVLGLVFARGPLLLLAVPLVAAFVLAVTALTYQFQGWLAGLMANPRRRRTVIVLFTLGFLLLSQLPNLVNMAFHSSRRVAPPPPVPVETDEEKALTRQLLDRKITPAEFQKRREELMRPRREQAAEEARQRKEDVERTVRVVNAVLPPGWLPLGVSGLAGGEVVPALLGTLGLTLIGAASLWRNYRATVRVYTGQGGSADRVARAARQNEPRPEGARPRLVEWRFPGVSEQASAVAAAGLRSLTRAPEAKMMLLVPVIMVLVFGSVLMTTGAAPPEPVRPLMAVGAAAFVLLMAAQLVGNQFGYDRTGFRAYVLSPIPRRDVLLGKNLAVAPPVLGLAAAAVALIAVVFPMRFDHLPAVLAQVAALYLLFCLMANGLSILAPIPIAAGSFQPSNVRIVPILFHLGFIAVVPFVLAFVLLPLGVEVLLAELAGLRGWPVALALSLVVLAAVVFAYRRVLTVQGNWLSAREQAILEVVTAKAE